MNKRVLISRPQHKCQHNNLTTVRRMELPFLCFTGILLCYHCRRTLDSSSMTKKSSESLALDRGNENGHSIKDVLPLVYCTQLGFFQILCDPSISRHNSRAICNWKPSISDSLKIRKWSQDLHGLIPTQIISAKLRWPGFFVVATMVSEAIVSAKEKLPHFLSIDVCLPGHIWPYTLRAHFNYTRKRWMIGPVCLLQALPDSRYVTTVCSIGFACSTDTTAICFCCRDLCHSYTFYFLKQVPILLSTHFVQYSNVYEKECRFENK